MFISYLMLAGQAAPLALAAAPRAARPARAAESGVTAPAQAAAPAPAPLVFAAPNIVATKNDTFLDPNGNGKAEPGDTITYTVTVTNTGDLDATGVTFNDSVDTNTSLVPGSVNTQPIAEADAYNVIGNVRIQPNAAQGLLANDRDPDSGNSTGLTASGPSTTAQGGNITINSDGSFSYNPAPGFTGTDTVTYTVRDAGADTTPGNADDKTDTAVATFTVGNGTATPGSNVVWFVNPAAPSGGDGRLTSPFNCYTGVAASCFSQTAADDPGDAIFLFSGSHTGGYALLANQKLIGAGATATLAAIAGLTVPTASDALPSTGGAAPAITTTNVNAVPLPTGATNTPLLRGFTVGNTGTGAKISGTNFGTLTVGNNVSPDVALSGTGQALNLSTGAFNATSGFASVATTSSAAQGINLAGISGTVSFGSTSVSGSTTQGILIGTTTAAINFGNTTVTGGTDGISFQNNSSGTRTIGTLGVSGGSGSAFLHGAGGGNVTVSGAATLSSAGDVVNIQNANNGATVNFAGGATVTKTSTGGNGVNWSGTNTGATLIFATLALTTSNGTGMNLAGGGAVNVTTAAGSFINSTGVGAQAAPAINANSVALGLNFTTVTVNGGGSGTGTGINLVGCTGAMTISNGASTATNIQNTGGTGISVATSSTVLNFGNTTVNGTGNANGDDTGMGVLLSTNTGAITFGALNVTPDSGERGLFAAANTGAITTTSGTITTTNNTAVSIAGTNSGSKTPVNVTLTTVNTTGGATAPNGIFLRFLSTTGSPGGFVVAGNGGTCTFASSGTCTGGRITNTSGADNTTNGIGVYMEDVAGVSLTRMHIDINTNFGVRGTTVNGFTLESSVIDGNNGTSHLADDDTFANGEGSVKFRNLTGSASIQNSFVGGGYEKIVEVVNNAGTLNRLTINNCIIGDLDGAGAQRGVDVTNGDDALLVNVLDGATALNVTVTNSTFNNARGDVVQFNNADNVGGANAAMDVVFRQNKVSNNHPNKVVAGGGVTLSTSGPMTYDVSCNSFRDSNGHGLNVFKGGGSVGAVSGTVFNNAIGVTGVVRSGAGGGANGLNMDSQGAGSHTTLVKNNVIRNYSTAGINLNLVDLQGSANTFNATVIGNTIAEPDTTAGTPSFASLLVNVGAIAGDSNGVMNLRVGSATVAAEKNSLSNAFASDFDAYIERVAATGNLSRAGSASNSPPQIIVDDNVATLPNVFVNAAIVPTNAVPALPAAVNEACTIPTSVETFDGDEVSSPGGITTESATAEAKPATAAPAPWAPTISGVTGRAYVPARATTTTVLAPRALTTAAATTATNNTTAPATTRDAITVNGSGGTVNVTIGTLHPGDSVTITFQVVVDNPYGGGPNVSNQGQVSGTNFTTVNTDDPGTGAAGDPTLTPINATDIRVNDAQESEPASGTRTMLFALVLSQPAPAGGITVNYSTTDGTATGGASCDGTADYLTATNQPVTVPQGARVATIPVTVCADNVGGESSETLTLTISGASSGTIQDATATGTITQGDAPGAVLISELRTSGPGGAGDDFVELYNNSDSPKDVSGYGLFKTGAGGCGDVPVLVATMPGAPGSNTTVIPARGHRLIVGSAYSLTNYGGAGAAAGDQTLTSDLENDANVGLFTVTDPNLVSTAARVDAVGFGANTGGACDLMREGTNLPAVSGSTIEYSFFRKECDFTPGVGCAAGGNPKDSNNNSADFHFADTAGTVVNGQQRLGAPGPERSNSPVRRDTGGKITLPLLDQSQATSAAPNRARDFTPGDPTTSPNGTFSIRRRVQNNTGGVVTRLRFRLIELTTFPNPGGGQADLRALTSSSVVISGINDPATCASTGTPATTPCQVTAQATVLETPPAQPNGGGYNSTLSLTLPGGGLANGASIDVNFTLGVVQSGTFRFTVIIEALP